MPERILNDLKSNPVILNVPVDNEFSGSTESKYSSVEFSLKNLDSIYQFKIWESAIPGINILVNRNSVILKYLEVGNTLDIKYYPSDCSGYPVTMRTEIKHIKKDCEGRIKGHFLVGLAVNEIGKNN